ncbi:MAG: HAD family hydrolase [Reyranellaceae bacterium]
MSDPFTHDAIVFDLGGVIVDWQPRYVYESVFDDAAELEFFLKNVCNGAWLGLTDGGGHAWETAGAELAAKFPQYREAIALFRPRWQEMLRGEFAETVAILQRLKSDGHRLLALTNWAADTWDESLARLPSLALFEGVLVSGKEGLRKPNAAIYRLLCDRYGVDPARSIFIDDHKANVDAAAQLGFDALFFSTPAQLATDLTQRGVLRG